MKTYLDCYPCIVKQTIEAAKMVSDDESFQRDILNAVLAELPKFPLTASPPEIAVVVHRLVKKTSGNKDPYKEIKEHWNKKAMNLYPELLQKVSNSSNRLLTAAKLAIAGNIIDFGVAGNNFDIHQTIENALSTELAINHFDSLKQDLAKASSVLYIGDNSGEIVFDKLFIEEISENTDAEIIFAVRGEPILNDVTLEDARFVGMDTVAQVISNGYDVPGTVLSHSSEELQKAFEKADVIIAKGQGNYETMSGIQKKIFFILKVKCKVLGRDMGREVGDNIIMCSKNTDK